MFESFSMGLGTAAFLSFLMRICDKGQAATQYAILTALYAAPRFLLGPLGGHLAQSWGYAPFFALTFLMALPAYALLPWVRKWVGNGNGQMSPRENAGSTPATSPGSGDPAGRAQRRPASVPAR